MCTYAKVWVCSEVRHLIQLLRHLILLKQPFAELGSLVSLADLRSPCTEGTSSLDASSYGWLAVKCHVGRKTDFVQTLTL